MGQQGTLLPNVLLAEIGRFLDQTLVMENLSEEAAGQRHTLRQMLTIYMPNSDPSAMSSYLDMNAKSDRGGITLAPVNGTAGDRGGGGEYVGADAPPIVEEEYEDLGQMTLRSTTLRKQQQSPSATSSTMSLPDDSAHMQAPASEMRARADKAGPLLRKERVFFMDQLRRYWACVIQTHLYFYGGEKDAKPACVIDLRGLEARPVPALMKDAKKRDACFELVCPGKKTIQLVARTAKDMQQWVRSVSQASCLHPAAESQPPQRRQLPSIPDCDDNETYDDIESILQGRQDILPPPPPPPIRAATTAATAVTLVPEEDDDDIYHDISHNGYDSDQSLYDDIGIYSPANSTYYNTSRDKSEAVPSESRSEKTSKEEAAELPPEEEEAFYDDIGANLDISSVVTRPLPGIPHPSQFNPVNPSPFNTVNPSPFNPVNPSPFNTVNPSPFNTLNPSPFNTVNPSPFNPVNPSPFNAVKPSPFNLVNPRPFNTVKPNQFNAAKSRQFNAAKASLFNLIQPSSFNSLPRRTENNVKQAPPVEEEELYDDIGVHSMVTPRRTENNGKQAPPVEEEELYDDIGVHSQIPPPEVRPLPPAQSRFGPGNASTSSNKIQNLIQQMEASLGK